MGNLTASFKDVCGLYHYIQYTGIDFTPSCTTTLASAIQSGNTDTKLYQVLSK